MVQLTQAGRLPEQALKHVRRAIEAEPRFPQPTGSAQLQGLKIYFVAGVAPLPAVMAVYRAFVRQVFADAVRQTGPLEQKLLKV